MKLKNLILLVVLASGLLQTNIWGAESAAAGAPVAETAEEGPLAKIALLHGQMTGIPEEYRGATLVHGALLWEFGMIKSLYNLLVTPEKKDDRLYPKEAICPLGDVLMQFFYLAGGTLAPTQNPAVCANYLTPDRLGNLYKKLMQQEVGAWTMPASKSRFKKKSPLEAPFNESCAMLKAALIGCETTDALNPPNLCASVIMAFFWIKHIIKAKNIAEAKENLFAFNTAAGLPNEQNETAIVDYTNNQLETKAIERISELYKYNLPVPLQAMKVSVGTIKDFGDCVEAATLMELDAAFFDPKTRTFKMPAKPAGFYDPQVVTFIQNNSTATTQNAQKVRNDWAAIMANRPNIAYAKTNCELDSTYLNTTCLLAQLVPGVYQMLARSCTTNGTCKWSQIAKQTTGLTLSKHIQQHFTTSPACQQKMIELFATEHGLRASGFEINTAKKETSWNIAQDASCYLNFSVKPGHMACNLQGTQAALNDPLADPIFDCINALGKIPENPDSIYPLLFAAARLIQRYDAATGLLAIVPHMPKEQALQILNNITHWGLLSAEAKKSLNRYNDLRTGTNAMLVDAAKAGLAHTCMALCMQGANINTQENEFESTPLVAAAEWGHINTVKALCNIEGINLNGQDITGETALMLAARGGYTKIIDVLCKLAANVNLQNDDGKTALMLAAEYNHLETVKRLWEWNAQLDIEDGNYKTAAMIAREKGFIDIAEFLEESAADAIL